MSNLYNKVRSALFSDFKATITYGDVPDLKTIELGNYTETVLSDRVILSYNTPAEVKKFEVIAKFTDKNIVLYVDAVLNNLKFYGFAGVSFKLGNMKPDRILGNYSAWGPFWNSPSFNNSFDDLGGKHFSLLIKEGDQHWALAALCGDNFRAECEGGRLDLSAEFGGLEYYSGAFASIALSTDPYEAIDSAHRFARQTGAIRVPLRYERTLPEHFRKLGWCTWDAFYYDVCEELIFKKLDEFKEKNIPVKWVIIDDGWMQTGGEGQLCSFIENRAKFPSGLKAIVKRMKEEYGIEKVAVWHAFLGWWNGVHPQSELYEQMKDYLYQSPQSGRYLPSLDEEKAFVFWDTWHSYLEDCGIDFVKVDNQSSTIGLVKGIEATAVSCRHCHNAIERSILKHFKGAVVNCMGMHIENALARPMTAVSRNSDDFYPSQPGKDFFFHCEQNMYNALWHCQLYYGDFDMWWSNQEHAVHHGVLRAISGSPVYTSDQIGITLPENLMPVIEDNGDVMMCDENARPTADCLYTNCRAEGRSLKVYNFSGDNFALAVFNVKNEKVTENIDFSAIPGLGDGEYVAYEYFTKKYFRIKKNDSLPFDLEAKGIAAFSIYPVKADENKDEYVMMGSTEKYIPIASKNKIKVSLGDIKF